MNVGFEAKRFFSNFTGLGNYSRFVVNALSQFAPEHHYALFAPRIRSHPEYDHILTRDNVTAIGPDGWYRSFPGLWRTYGVTRSKEAGKLDIFHGLSHEIPYGLPRTVRKVVTVHDLIFLRYPEYYNPVDVAIYRAKVSSACKRADRVIAISEQTARDVVQFLKVDEQKISVVYQGCHHAFTLRSGPEQMQKVRSAYGLPQEFILNVGTVERRKNIGVLVEALALLAPDQRIPLVIIGRETSYRKEVVAKAHQLGVADLLFFPDKVAFGDLPTVYQMARVFVYPSLFEGFGIPLVEAIVSGVPVISSVGSCFSEAAGPSSLYADPTRADELAKALALVLSDKGLRERMVEESYAYVRKFEPQAIASALVREYSRLLS